MPVVLYVTTDAAQRIAERTTPVRLQRMRSDRLQISRCPREDIFDSGFGDLYGDHVETWKNWVFVGAPRELSDRGERDGAVYIYKKKKNGTLKLRQKLVSEGNAPAGSFGDRLGAGLAAANGWLLAGVANDQSFPGIDPRGDDFSFAGKVYVYRQNDGSWTKVQELTSPEPGGFGSFGVVSNWLWFSPAGL